MYEITGAWEIVFVAVVFIFTGIFTAFLVVLNAHKKELWEEFNARINKTNDKRF